MTVQITNSNGASVKSENSRFRDFLVVHDLLSTDDLEKADEHCHKEQSSFCAAIRQLALIDPNFLASKIAEFHDLPLLSDDHMENAIPPLEGLSRAFLREHNVVPIAEQQDGFLIAIEDPENLDAINAVRLALKRPVMPIVAAAVDIHTLIDRSENGPQDQNQWQNTSTPDENQSDVEHLRDIALDTPVVRFVNQLFEEAIRRRATDIHIEPFGKRLVVRLRIDGMLQETAAPPAQMSKAIVSRLKILSGLNIAERRLPQDGRSKVQVGQQRLDLRIATIPTMAGEAVAIRLLDNVRRVLDFAKLGFSDTDEENIRNNLMSPHGLFLVTGPTGSGKTTTLAAALSLLNRSHRKILTIEDPVEYEIEGVNQTQTKPEIGLTFARGLRSFLRHDPDVLMVGEMRDSETANIGVHAALTGHLVLTTLHTNSAIGTIPRLMDMGVDPYLLASTLRCIVAQRLIRLLCPHCKTLESSSSSNAVNSIIPEHMSAPHADTEIWTAKGCERCNGTGFFDRIVIAEVLNIDDQVRSMIKPDLDTADLEAAARNAGMVTMFQDGLMKVSSGLTTEQEIRRSASDL